MELNQEFSVSNDHSECMGCFEQKMPNEKTRNTYYHFLGIQEVRGRKYVRSRR